MLANVIWLYYWPFYLFGTHRFPLVALIVVLLEAAVLFAARVSWQRSLISSLVANAVSYFVGLLLVSALRGSTLLPDASPETFIEQSHLWRGFIIAYVLTVPIEALLYRAIIRSQRLPRLLMLAAIANLASYAVVIAVNWRSSHEVLRQMQILPDLRYVPDESPTSNSSDTKSQ